MSIRESKAADVSFIRAVHLDAFGQPEGPGISRLVCDLINDDTAQPVLSLVAEENNKIVGHILFSRVEIDGCEETVSAYILAPLAVVRQYQGKGIGRSLINRGIAILKDRGVELVFVLGDPNYYFRAGFKSSGAYNLQPPYKLAYPEAWMALELKPGILTRCTGVVRCAASLHSPEYW